MRILGQLLIGVLLAVPSVQAAFGPWDLDADGAAAFARKVEAHVAAQSGQLSLYLEVPAAQLRALADLPLLRELARALGLRGRLAGDPPRESFRHCTVRPQVPRSSG